MATTYCRQVFAKRQDVLLAGRSHDILRLCDISAADPNSAAIANQH